MLALAIENLVGYSKEQPSIFKTGQLTPVNDLKLLVKDYAVKAQNVIRIENCSLTQIVVANSKDCSDYPHKHIK